MDAPNCILARNYLRRFDLFSTAAKQQLGHPLALRVSNNQRIWESKGGSLANIELSFATRYEASCKTGI